MALSTSEIAILITAKNQAAAVLKSVERDLDTMGKRTSSLGDAAGVAGKALATGLAAGATAAAAGMGLAVKAAGDLQQAVANISTIKPEVDTASVFASLNEISTRVPQTAAELGDALYNIFSSVDVSQQQALGLVETFAKGAVGAATDAKTFGTAALGVLNAYGMAAEDAGHISDVFFNTINKGVLSGEELAANLGLVTQSAKMAGVDLDSLGAFIAGVTKEGGNAAQNMNNLNNLFQKITTKDAQAAMHSLGIATVDATGNFRPQIDVLQDLKDATAGMTEEARTASLQKIFPDLQARAGAAVILSQLDFVREGIEANKASVGSATAAYEKMSATFNSQSKLLANTVTSILATIGAELLPAITPVVTAFAQALPGAMKDAGAAIDAVRATFDLLVPQVEREEIWNNLKDAVVAIGEAFALLWPEVEKTGAHAGATSGTAGNLAGSLKELSAGVRDVAREVGPIIATFVEIGVALDTVNATSKRTSADIRTTVGGAFSALGTTLQNLGIVFTDFATLVGSTFSDIGTQAKYWSLELPRMVGLAFEQLGSNVRNKLDEVGEAVGGFFSSVGGVVRAGLDAIVGFLQAAWETIPEDIRDSLAVVAGLLVQRLGEWLASVGNSMSAIGTAVHDGMAAVIAAVGGAMSSIGTMVRSGWDLVTSTVGAAMSAVGSAVRVGWDAISGVVSTVLGTITSIIQAGWDSIVAAASTAWQAVGGVIGGALDAAVAVVQGWIATVIGVMRGLTGSLGEAGAEAGKAAVDGLVGAIGRGIQSVKDAAGNLARSALRSAEEALDAHSPSRKFARIGESIGQGLVQGIESSTPAVAQAMSGSLSSAMSGLQRGGGGFLTIPQFGSAIRALGFSESAISAICGPIAATGISEGLGKGMSLIDVESLATKIGAYSRGAGFNGPAMFQKLLSTMGIDSRSGGFQEAVDAAMKGIPVAISTPLHYFLAQGFDQATQQFVVGNTGTALRAGAEKMTRAAIEGVAGAATFIIPKVEAAGAAIRTLAGDIASSFGGVATPAVDSLAETLNTLTATVETESADIAVKMADIATKVADGIAKATEDGGRQIADAMRTAQDQLDRLGGSMADKSSVTVRQSGLEQQINDAKKAYALQRSEAEANFQHARALADAGLRFDRDIAKAKTDADKERIQESYKDQVDEMNARFSRQQADVARVRGLDAAERANALIEDAKLISFKEQLIVAERDAKVAAAQETVRKQVALAQEGAEAERLVLAQSYVAKLADLKAGLLDQLPGLTGEAAEQAQGALDMIATQTLAMTGIVAGAMGTTATAAEFLATRIGISLEQAKAIIADAGNTAQTVMATDIPFSFELTDKAVEEFAHKFGLNWEEARRVLTEGGRVADLVMGREIPKAAGEAVTALGKTGTAATELKTPIKDAQGALEKLASDGFDVAKKAQGQLATDMATQISFVLQQLSEKMPGLIKGIQDFVSELGKIPRDIEVNIRTINNGAGGSKAGSSAGSDHSNSGDDGEPSEPSGGSVDWGLANQDTQEGQHYRDELRATNEVGRNDDGSLYIEPKAKGGPVKKDTPYLVGEQGPEIFTPKQNGTIIPNKKSSQWGETAKRASEQIAEAAALLAATPRQRGGPVSAGQRYLTGEAGAETFVPRPNTGSGGGSEPIDYDKLAEKLADAFARKLPEVSLSVGVDDIHSALFRKSGRNGGTLGF